MNLSIGVRVTNPALGRPARVEPVQSRGVVRPQECGRDARENWSIRARRTKVLMPPSKLKRIRAPSRSLSERDCVWAARGCSGWCR